MGDPPGHASHSPIKSHFCVLQNFHPIQWCAHLGMQTGRFGKGRERESRTRWFCGLRLLVLSGKGWGLTGPCFRCGHAVCPLSCAVAALCQLSKVEPFLGNVLERSSPVSVMSPSWPSKALNGAFVTAWETFKRLGELHHKRMSLKRGKWNDQRKRIFTSSYCIFEKEVLMYLGLNCWGPWGVAKLPPPPFPLPGSQGWNLSPN